MSDALFRVIDFETTGLPEEENSRVCEVGWCDLYNGKIADPFSYLVNPLVPIRPEIRAVHHIGDADVADAPDFVDVIPMLKQGGPNYYVAHKSDFEEHYFKPPDIPWICTYRVALRLWPDAPSHSNQALRYFLGLELDERAMPPHRAGPDAFVTAHILVKCLTHGTASLADMVRWSSGPPLLPKVNFGKHYGAKWEDVPTDYLDWIISKSDMDKDIKANARHHLRLRHPQHQSAK